LNTHFSKKDQKGISDITQKVLWAFRFIWWIFKFFFWESADLETVDLKHALGTFTGLAITIAADEMNMHAENSTW